MPKNISVLSDRTDFSERQRYSVFLYENRQKLDTVGALVVESLDEYGSDLPTLEGYFLICEIF